MPDLVTFEAFMAELEEEARQDGPDAVAQFAALSADFEKLSATLTAARESPPGCLGNIAPVDRVLDLDEARLYRVQARMINDRMEVVPFPIGPLPIYNDSDELIGFGSPSLDNGLPEVDGAISYSTPERLLLEVDSKSLRFHLDGNKVVLR